MWGGVRKILCPYSQKFYQTPSLSPCLPFHLTSEQRKFNRCDWRVEQLWGWSNLEAVGSCPFPKLAASLLHSSSVVGKVEYQYQLILEEFLIGTNVGETMSQEGSRKVREGTSLALLLLT